MFIGRCGGWPSFLEVLFSFCLDQLLFYMSLRTWEFDLGAPFKSLCYYNY
ncbi:hypothetical protein NC652_003967 [Populus alba x Populus x berolinensis]|nr:hypothetical protein NC652_003967 [Populus alba x Populus x berolinensis]